MLKMVTVTGADDKTDPMDLIEISQRYPFVEFGILLSARGASARFPSQGWIREFYRMKQQHNPDLKASCHLCGSIVREIFATGDWGWAVELFKSVPMLFDRIQLNTHGVEHEVSLALLGDSVLEMLRMEYNIIFQYDLANTKAFEHVAAQSNRCGCHAGVHALFDLSHGEGRLSTSYPAPLPGTYCGYAGGLSPDNVREELDKIINVTKTADFWIDAETHLRSGPAGDDIFDPNLVLRFLKEASAYVNH